MIEIKIKSAWELLREIERIYQGDDRVIFRGQANRDWSLTPRISRMSLRGKFSADILTVESSLIEDFTRFAHMHLDSSHKETPLDILARAQHHGIPTRLLDWTTNPLVALWFAVRETSASQTHAVVWALPIEESDRLEVENSIFNLPKTSVCRPNHTNSRIAAQSGWFTIHAFDSIKRKFIDIREDNLFLEQLVQFTIPVTLFPPIREATSRCGVSDASIFPGLDGLCRHITKKYEMLPDEKNWDIYLSL